MLIEMQKKNRIMALLLALALLFSAVPMASATEDDALCFDVADGEVAVIDCDASVNGTLVIPSSVDGYPVTRIEDEAFSSCSKLTGITIPASVTVISETAFYGCTGLTAFAVDAGNPAFAADENGVLYSKDKTALLNYPVGNPSTAFTVPDSVTSIGAYAFAHARKLQSVTLAESVTRLGDYAFYFCAGLTEMALPDSVTQLGFGVMEGCSKLAAISFGRGAAVIGDNAFRLCKALTTITVDAENEAFTADGNNVLYSKDKTVLVQYPAGSSLTSFTVPESVTSIGVYAFGYAERLQSIELPDGLTELGESAFYSCTALETVNLPESVTVIGGDAFRECRNLNGVILPDSLTSIGYYAFYGLSLIHI